MLRVLSPRMFINRRATRRRGLAFVYVALGMLTLLGITGLVVDIGHLHMKEAQAMRAADAAALAGAMQLATNGDARAEADAEAREFARLNGYDPDANGVTFTGNIDPQNPNWYTVSVSRVEPLFFIRALPGIGPDRTVGARATAEYLSAVPVDIKMGSGVYGAMGDVNLAVFGPQSEYQHGDPYSPRWIDNNATPNPENVGFDGYDFELFVPENYSALNAANSDRPSLLNVEIFDPDTWNSTGNSPNGISEWDEIRQPYSGPGQQPISIHTETQFTLYKVVDPSNPSMDEELGKVSYRDDATTNNKWVLPNGFSIDTNTWGSGLYRINVKATDGSSENGFDLRAGPPPKTGEEFNPENGTNITATGRIPINFNKSGMTTIALGEVPAAAAGGDLIIKKFDTDIQSKTVFYTSDPPASNQPPGGFQGVLSENAKWKEDAPIQLPSDYQTAKWYATYEAGWQDTSVWTMQFSSPVAGLPGGVKLVGRAGQSY